ncbi:histidine kinase [Rhizobacter sp. J219]|jgi:signal transduction histidine kinase|uniref:sensor histidine kinase n=1 Tax=Rhizobacter sp. J219 TaxID=2898430 RepID=UPI0021511210|nr:histidine kinase [Rhizobacter sp. J219]MCR5886042.1 histidine kinase [Rhizobacter sp. J219]
MYLSSTPRAEPRPRSSRAAVQFVVASAVVWAVAAALLFILVPGLESFPRLLVFSECVGLTMVACVVLLQRQRRLERLAAGTRWLLTGVIAIPVGYLLGHQIAFLLLGEPMRLVGHQHISLVPILFTVLVGGLGLRHFATREQLAREAAARAEAQHLAVEAQLRLLRTQLEPHMLFNTLANLRGLVREDADRAEAMIDRLIVYLRGTLSASQTESVPLGREFAQLRAYLEIMSLRMGPRLTFRLELPAELEGTQVPPMLLQPLVENAIKHGLEPKVGSARIEVVARATDAGIEIRVDDDGLGLPAPDHETPEDGAPAGPESSSYGLRHVRERLKAVYGPAARLDLERRQPAGVSSIVFFPRPT